MPKSAGCLSLHPQAAGSLYTLQERGSEAIRLQEMQVIRLLYGVGSERRHTCEEVGELLGETVERVREIEDGTLRKLRSPVIVRRLNKGVSLERCPACRVTLMSGSEQHMPACQVRTLMGRYARRLFGT